MSELNDNMDFVDIFEQKLCEYTGFKYAVCVDCCTNGILLSLEALRRFGKIKKETKLIIPSRTYMSVPMTLINNGWKVRLKDEYWSNKYEIGNTNVFDAATDLNRLMVRHYPDDAFVCISFQQKKRLSLGRGGVILFNNPEYVDILKRLRYDGRNNKMSDRKEISEHSKDIIIGYHCYMEPDKAAQGILKLNQVHLLPEYKLYTSNDYEDLTQLEIFNEYF